jgi:hypothetical protein
MMKVINNLQKDVQIHPADNKRLKKAKRQQEDFNMKLMRSLERIEKKLDKESGSNKSRSHRSPNEEIKERSGNRHHQHSQGIPKGGHTADQVHLLPEIIGDLKWMN